MSEQLNTGKWGQVEAFVTAYAQEKQSHLSFYLSGLNFTTAATDRIRRDELVKQGYASPFGLQARAWKHSLKEAYETVVKWYAAIGEEIRARLFRLKWTDAQRHYANWLLCNEPRLATLILSRGPINPAIKLSLLERKQVQNYIRRTFRRLRGHAPQVRMYRSVTLDAGMYTVRTDAFRQVIEIAGLTPGNRIAVLLKGQTTITGNIRLVLNREHRSIEIHTSFGLRRVPALGSETVAVDAGLTEVFTDDEGNQYGTELKDTLIKASEELRAKGKRRNKLHSVKEKARTLGKQAKAARIQANNLGTKKQAAWKQRLRQTVARIINYGLNQLVEQRAPRTVVTESLDLRGKAKSKSLSRRVSLWHRSLLNERTEFKASAKGFSRKQVNPAYSSQLCPRCGYLDRRNRVGDTFQCLKCKHAACSDRVAAVNLRARMNDPEIHRWTPPVQVRAVLVARYNARLESRKAGEQSPMNETATVPGQTLDTRPTTLIQRRGRASVRLGGQLQPAPPRQSKNKTAGGKTAGAKHYHF